LSSQSLGIGCKPLIMYNERRVRHLSSFGAPFSMILKYSNQLEDIYTDSSSPVFVVLVLFPPVMLQKPELVEWTTVNERWDHLC